MSTDSIITVISTIVTIIATIITIRQARAVSKYKKKIAIEVRKINLSAVAEHLRIAQEAIRSLPTSNKKPPRGTNVHGLIKDIKRCYDNSLNTLRADGPEFNIREEIKKSQDSLNTYEKSLYADSLDEDSILKVQQLTQDSISMINGNLSTMGGM